MACLKHKILVFTYHKSGTVLFEKVMGRVGARLGLQVQIIYGRVTALNSAIDITIMAHSLLGLRLKEPFRGIRILRDPRDIWVSGYLYHRRCSEGWCVNTDMIPRSPIGYPHVPLSMLHLSESTKRNFLNNLGGRSYQQNLLDRDLVAGLAFELSGYTATTLNAISEWQPRQEVLDVKLEALVADYDATMVRIFNHLGLNEEQCAIAVELAAAEDVRRMDNVMLDHHPHIFSRTLSKWRQILTVDQVVDFERKHGDLIKMLGYDLEAS